MLWLRVLRLQLIVEDLGDCASDMGFRARCRGVGFFCHKRPFSV